MTERLHFHFSLSCIGEGHGSQCSCLENPRDRGARWAAVYGFTHSQTRLKWLSSSSSSSIIALLSEKILDIISISLNLLMFDLWPKMRRMFRVHLRKEYSSAFGWNVLKISIRSVYSNISFWAYVSFLTFWFVDRSIGIGVVLTCPTITVLLSISPFGSVIV